MRKFLILGSLVIMFAVSGCTPPVQHATPSGKVEVTINGVKKAAVKDKITDVELSRGYTITKSDEHTLILEQPAPGAFLYGSQYDGTPNVRLTYQLAQIKGSVRVVVDYSIITNPGSAYEHKSDLNGTKNSLEIQTRLNKIKADMERK